MDIMQELLEAAAHSDLELEKKRQSTLQQHILNLRAKAAIAGIADMQYMVETQQKLETEKGK
jgi:hypothetical protein